MLPPLFFPHVLLYLRRAPSIDCVGCVTCCCLCCTYGAVANGVYNDQLIPACNCDCTGFSCCVMCLFSACLIPVCCVCFYRPCYKCHHFCNLGNSSAPTSSLKLLVWRRSPTFSSGGFQRSDISSTSSSRSTFFSGTRLATSSGRSEAYLYADIYIPYRQQSCG